MPTTCVADVTVIVVPDTETVSGRELAPLDVAQVFTLDATALEPGHEDPAGRGVGEVEFASSATRNATPMFALLAVRVTSWPGDPASSTATEAPVDRTTLPFTSNIGPGAGDVGAVADGRDRGQQRRPGRPRSARAA